MKIFLTLFIIVLAIGYALQSRAGIQDNILEEIQSVKTNKWGIELPPESCESISLLIDGQECDI